jgi:hypothetical protein
MRWRSLSKLKSSWVASAATRFVLCGRFGDASRTRTLNLYETVTKVTLNVS